MFRADAEKPREFPGKRSLLPGARVAGAEDEIMRAVETFSTSIAEERPPDVLTHAARRADFDGRPLPEEAVFALERAAAGAAVPIRLVRDPAERALIAGLVAEGDRILFADPAYRFELGARWRAGAPAGDAEVEALLPVPDLFPGLGSFYVSTFDLGELQAKRDFRLAAHAPLLLVVSEGETTGMRPAVLEATRQLVIAAEAAGLAASFFNQPIFVPELRRRLAAGLGLAAPPRAVLGVGTVGAPARA